MLLNSYAFILCFLPVALLGYHVLSTRVGSRAALGFLTLCSLAYGGYFQPTHAWLLIVSIGANFVLANAIRVNTEHERRRSLLALGVFLNLMWLGTFKYAGSLVNAWAELLKAGAVPSIVLPLAVSFYTFQQIAYLVDTYRGQTARASLLDYTLFISFFPKLVAGPIVRHDEMLPQLGRAGRVGLRPHNLAVGVTLFAAGLFKKVVFADGIAQYASPIFDAAQGGATPQFGAAWLGAIAYALQIYFDFSGYSDMAIGLAHLFGFRLPINFDSPYKATSIIDFWRRWHITLSRFLRDYVYVPLGGNRKGPTRRYVNLVLTMLLGGVWHGAGWNFVLWGGLHGAYLMVNHGYRALRPKLFSGYPLGAPVHAALATLMTLLCVIVAWVPFAAASHEAAGRVLWAMCGGAGFDLSSLPSRGALAFIAGLLCVVWLLPNTQEWMAMGRPTLDGPRRTALTPSAFWPARLYWRPSLAWAAVGAAELAFALIQLNQVTSFVYYQF
jgi:alginate O-acetyltransferase complex protein AlgI